MCEWEKSQKRIDFDEIREYLDDVLGSKTAEYLIKTGKTLEEMVDMAREVENELDEERENQSDEYYSGLDLPENI